MCIMNNVFFTADLHLGHCRILNMSPNRPFAAAQDIDAHDKYIIQRWNEIADKHDSIYILGDFCLRPAAETRKILERLNGRKYLCPGNHDRSLKSLSNYFERIQQIMDVRFRPSQYPFLREEVRMVLCHYPLQEWDGMQEGVMHLHGHTHGNLADNPAIKLFDVGFDATGEVLTPLSTILKKVEVPHVRGRLNIPCIKPTCDILMLSYCELPDYHRYNDLLF